MSTTPITKLVLEDGQGQRVDEFPLGPRPITIGREGDCTVRLPSPFVSERHATVHPNVGASKGWALTPHGLNGTRINHRLVREEETHPLKTGDIIEVPGFMLRLVDPLSQNQGHRHRLEMNRRYSEETAALHRRLLEEVDLRTLTTQGVSEGIRKQRIQEVLNRLLQEGAEIASDLETFILQESFRGAVLDKLFEPERPLNWHPSAHERAFGELVGTLARRLGALDGRLSVRHRAEDIGEGFQPMFDSMLSNISQPVRRFAIRRALRKDLENLIFHLGPIEDLLRLPDLNEIMVIGNHRIFIETKGQLQETGRAFPRQDDLEVVIGRIVNPVGRFVNRSHPIVDARLKDGSRVNIVVPPVSIRGPAITIRKFRQDPFTFEELVRSGTLGWHAAKFLRGAVVAKKNMIISGGTSSGKTTLLNCLCRQISSDERVVVIEDAVELQLSQPNQVVLEAKKANIEGEGEVPIRELMRAALRMRPDRIIVGECRGQEALDMLQAMNTGHEGSLTTAHANSPSDLISRLEVMVLEAGENLPLPAIHRQIASALHLVVQIQRQSDRQRRVTHISEVVAYDVDEERVIVEDIFRLEQSMQCQDEPPQLAFTGYLPTFIDELLARGETRLEDLFRAVSPGPEISANAVP